MQLLTRILSHQPSPLHAPDSSTQTKYRQLTKKDIEKLPTHLKKESGQEKNLCKMHAGLNSAIVSKCFVWVHKLVEVSIPNDLAELINADIDIPKSVTEPFLHLLEINSMWIPPASDFHHRRQSNKEKRWAFQQDGCKACILARLGGEEDIVTPLRAAVVAKLSVQDIPKSRRLVWLAQLVSGGFTDDIARRTFEKSTFLGKALRRATKSAASKKAKHAEYWNLNRAPEAAHIADVVKEVRPFDDNITREERKKREQYQAWQTQQQQTQMKKKERSVSPLYEVDPTALNATSNPFTTPPQPPPATEKDTNEEIYARIDSVYNAYHPSSFMPQPPPPPLPPKHILLPRLNTHELPTRSPRPTPQMNRVSSIYSTATHELPASTYLPPRASSIYDITDAMRESIHSTAGTVRTHHKPLNVPDRAEEYRALIHGEEKEVLGMGGGSVDSWELE
jgi:hypothetical protein